MQNDNNHKNLAAAILENGGYSSDTSLTIPTTSAATFPDVPFFATIMPTTDLANSNNSEIVEVTATSTSGSDTTFTISRGQRGTTAINWDAGKAVLVHAIYTEDVVYIDTTLSTPTNIAYVSTDNIQDGAVTSQKIDSATFDLTTITQNIGTSWNGNRQYLKRIGDIVFVQATVVGATLAAATATDFFTIPEGFRPTTSGQAGKNQVLSAFSYPSNNTGSVGGAYLYNQGNTIRVWVQTAINNKELTVQGFYIL